MLKCCFKTVNFPKQISNIEMRACLLPSLVHQFTVLPVNFITEKYMNPVVDCILDILQKTEIVFPDNIAIIVIIAHTLSNHQFVPVLIIREKKYFEKAY